MSRSYKRNLVLKSGKHGSRSRSFFKNYANRIIRRQKDVPNGKAYRKIFDSWDISDYRQEYNPRPRVYSWGGKIVRIDPDPIWKWRSK